MSDKRKRTPDTGGDAATEMAAAGDSSIKKHRPHSQKPYIVYNNTKIPFPKPKGRQGTYCVCRKEDNGELMVGCDCCDDWFHFDCLKLDKRHQKLYYKFYCPYCELKDPEANRSVFKKKCMLPDCCLPIAKNSKFCSKEHGLAYFNDVKSKIAKSHNQALMGNVVSLISIPGMDFSRFSSFGESLLDPSKTVMADQFREFKLQNEDYIAEKTSLHSKIQKNEIQVNYTRFKQRIMIDLILLKNNIINSHVNKILGVDISPENSAADSDASANSGKSSAKKGKKKKGKNSKSSLASSKKRFEVCGFDCSLLTKNQIQWIQYLRTANDDSSNSKKVISANPETFSDVEIHFDESSFKNELAQVVKTSVEELSSFQENENDPTICLLERKKCQRHSGWHKRIQDEHDLTMERLAEVKATLSKRESSLSEAVCTEFWESIMNKKDGPSIESTATSAATIRHASADSTSI